MQTLNNLLTIICLLSTLLITTSCNKDFDSDDLDGKWNLVEFTCHCDPGQFEVGEHVWDFNFSENELTVFNKQAEDLQILNTGKYHFSRTNNNITLLSIEYDYYFEKKTLYLDYLSELDGPLMKFVKR